MDSEVVEIKKGCSYTSQNSHLVMKVLNVYHVGESYVKIKGILSNKKNGIIYETKTYKLMKDQIRHWVPLGCGVCAAACGNEWCCANN